MIFVAELTVARAEMQGVVAINLRTRTRDVKVLVTRERGWVFVAAKRCNCR